MYKLQTGCIDLYRIESSRYNNCDLSIRLTKVGKDRCSQSTPTQEKGVLFRKGNSKNAVLADSPIASNSQLTLLVGLILCYPLAC